MGNMHNDSSRIEENDFGTPVECFSKNGRVGNKRELTGDGNVAI